MKRVSLVSVSASLISLALAVSMSACGSGTPSSTSNEGVHTTEPATLLTSMQRPERQQAPHDVIVQLFNWPFQKITAEIPTLAAQGYGQVHVSPPNLSIASDQWWGRYQPVDYRLIAGPLGNETEFRAMIAEAHAHGIKIIIDIVFNHTANPSSPYPAEAAEIAATQGELFQAIDYHKAACIQNYDDLDQVRNARICGGNGDQGLPDLDQNSSRVLSAQHAFLKRLTAMGVDGYRFDAVKHMEPDYFKKLLTDDVAKGKFIFGEIIADSSSFDRDISPYLATKTMGFYDFPLRSTIQGAFSPGGSLNDLVDEQLVAKKRGMPAGTGVGFVMNHDIPNNDGFRSMILDPVDEELAYAYLLGRAGTTPYVYSDLGLAGGGGIRDERWNHAHRSPKLVSLVKFHNAVAGQSMKVITANKCLIAFQRGSIGVMLINKCDIEEVVSLDGRLGNDIELRDTFDGTTYRSSESVTVPGRSSLGLIAL
jgi:alpha-amylase